MQGLHFSTRSARGLASLLLGALIATGCQESGSRSGTLEDDSSGQLLISGLAPIGPFQFLDQDGDPFIRSDLDGKIWVVDFVFTRCGGPCPRMTENLRSISMAFEGDDDVRFLTISVDPEFDTPEVLKEYARRYRADTSRWKFVSGDKAATYQLAAGSFFLPVEDPEDTDQIIHSTRFVILSRDARPVAYHDEQANENVQESVIASVRKAKALPASSPADSSS